LKNEKEKKTLIKNKEDKTKEQENKNEHPDSNANDQERSQSENPETANDEGEPQSPKANWDCLKISKLIGVIILVGCSIGFLVLPKKIELTYLNSSVTNVIYDIFKVLNRRFNDDKRIDLT
jgi:hypothetical protein